MGMFIEAFEAAPEPPSDALLQVRTGKIKPLGGVAIRSAIAKVRRSGKTFVTEVGLAGDEQHYEHHGGRDKALHQYCQSHYEIWSKEQPDSAHLFKTGGFGENLVSSSLSENNVCIGDKFKLGPEVVIQVSEPRQPCYKLNHRFAWKRAAIETQATGRTGWYYRVLKTGFIEEGDKFELIERPNPQWSVSRVQQFLYKDVNNLEALGELSQLNGLGQETMGVFRKRLVKGSPEDMSIRLQGLPSDRLSVSWHTYKLTEKASLTPRVQKLIFTVSDDSVDMGDQKFEPFSHIRLKFGPKHSFTRAYSIVRGDFNSFELGIARDDNSRGGSQYLHDSLQVGDLVEVAKGNDIPIDQKSQDTGMRHVFIIGGIGITAFLQEIAKLEESGADYQVHYAVRSHTEAAYLDLLSKFKTTIYAKDQGSRLSMGSVIPSHSASDGKTMIYCCGPASLAKACREETTALNYPKSQVHFEDFGNGWSLDPGEPFEVQLKASGRVLQVPSERTLLQVLHEAGMDIPSSCVIGNCGTCVVDYCKGGVVEHKGVALTEEEKEDSLLSCVSRGKGRIIIDFEN